MRSKTALAALMEKPLRLGGFDECRSVRGKLNDSRPIVVYRGDYVVAVIWGGPDLAHNEKNAKMYGTLLVKAAAMVGLLEAIAGGECYYDCPETALAHCRTHAARALLATLEQEAGR